MWDRLGRRSDRRAKKNTDLIKVKYALPAMWVIILDLCINPFFLPVLVGRAAPASRPPPFLANPPGRPALFPLTPYGFSYLSTYPRTSSGIHLGIPVHPAPAFLLSSVLTWIRFQCTFSGISSSFQSHAYESR